MAVFVPEVWYVYASGTWTVEHETGRYEVRCRHMEATKEVLRDERRIGEISANQIDLPDHVAPLLQLYLFCLVACGSPQLE